MTRALRLGLVAIAALTCVGCEDSSSVPARARDLGGGLIIQDLVTGDGPAARPSGSVEIEFIARFRSGEVWDSTDARGRSMTLRLDDPALIPGLRRGLTGIRAGGVRVIEIPWALAYGEVGREPIPPKTDLIYEVTAIRVIDRSVGTQRPTSDR